VTLTILRKQTLSFEAEFGEAERLAHTLEERMSLELLRNHIEAVHKLGGTSHQVQALLRTDLEALGFESERKGLFGKSAVRALRPDFYRRQGRSGIIAEVERGKTITNNMDLLDLWKCHLCAEADFLFLIVPMSRVSKSGGIIKAFEQATRRLETFFEPQNYVNVDAVFVFGY
jgi:hypothetical protein